MVYLARFQFSSKSIKHVAIAFEGILICFALIQYSNVLFTLYMVLMQLIQLISEHRHVASTCIYISIIQILRIKIKRMQMRLQSNNCFQTKRTRVFELIIALAHSRWLG